MPPDASSSPSLDVGLFALAAPAGWSLQRLTADTFVLSDPAHEIALTFLIAPHDLTPKSPASAQRNIHSEFAAWLQRHPHVRVRHAPRALPAQPHPALTADGSQRLASQTPWYLRLFRRPLTLTWRFWTLLGPRSTLLIRTAARADLLDRFSFILDAVIASIRLPNTDILTGSRFTNALFALARNRFPDTLVSIADEDTLRVGGSPVSLRALRLRYLEAPTQLAAHAKKFFAAVAAQLPASHLIDEWAAARDCLMPILLNPSDLHASPERLVSEQWINRLSVGYILENAGNPERPITAADSHHWGISLDTIHDHALANLVRRSRDQTMQGQKTDDYTMLVLAAPDRHNAARILLPEFYQRLRQHLGGTFYAAVPSRELLVAFSAARDDLRERLRKQIAHDFSAAQNALSDKLFLITPDGIAGDPDEAEDFAF
ncbi:MAG TPA: hypothetical protein VH253_16165 [Phycisphaerae bacterium]|nr:hypothetical protein [Phycisphaerae bacterium]